MCTRVVIRQAAPEDYDAIVELWRDAGLSVRTAGRDGRKAYLQQLPRFATLYLVAEAAGRMVGVVLGTHDVRKGWINRLAVQPGHRRMGIAQELIAACERAMIELGIEIFAALVEDDNEVSVQTFERAGYKRDIPVHYLHKRLREDV